MNTTTESRKNQALVKISTKDMSREDWLTERRKSIGGSDAAAILGLNPWNSPYSLWAEKTGKLTPEDISDKESVRLGNDLENYVAQRFMEETGKKVRRENYLIRSPLYPFAHADIDRWVIGENAGLECKTSSSWEMAKQCREGEIPRQYYCQCVHYMMVTGAERWYLGILVFGTGFFLFTIERNEAEIEALAAAEKDFWENVTNDTAPGVDGSEATTEAVKVIYSEANPGSSIDLTAVADALQLYYEARKRVKEAEQLRDTFANRVKEFMGECEKGSFGTYSVSWKEQSSRELDKDMLEATFGKIPESCYKSSTYRVFRVTNKKSA